MLICNIIFAGRQVRLVKNRDGEAHFRAFDEASDSGSEEIHIDEELEEWLNDDKARKESFERRMSAMTACDSLIERGEVWHVAG